MKVLRNHFNGNPTILIEDRIINGCQNFTIDEAPGILEKYDVPPDVWQKVLDVYTGVSSEEEILGFVKDPDPLVRAAVAEYGYGLDVLVNDQNLLVRMAVARQGYGLDVLVTDPDWRVRVAVAERGYGLDVLINDPDKFVREEVELKLE